VLDTVAVVYMGGRDERGCAVPSSAVSEAKRNFSAAISNLAALIASKSVLPGEFPAWCASGVPWRVFLS
jgi:hypothetical protein